MLEINKTQLMSFDEINRLRILKYIALGLIKYKESDTNDGFLVSEYDFKTRGQGDLFGIRQSGDMQFKLVNIKQDYQMIVRVQHDLLDFLRRKEDEYLELKKYLKEIDLLD